MIFNMEDNNEKLFRVIFGVSSVGKSTFIKQQLTAGIIATNTRILMAYELQNKKVLEKRPSIIHYNAMRPYMIKDKVKEKIDLQNDNVATILFSNNRLTAVTVLVASRTTIKQRIIQRKYVEPILKDNFTLYPKEKILKYFQQYCMVDVYRKWIEFFIIRNIATSFYSTEKSVYEKLGSAEEALERLCYKSNTVGLNACNECRI